VKIVGVTSTVVALPRSETLTTSYGSGDLATTVLVQLHTDGGHEGIGQTAVAPRSYGETAEGILANVQAHLAPVVVGREVDSVEAIHHELMRALPHHWSSHAGVEIALWDLKAKSLGVPVYELLGGKVRDGLTLMGFVHHAAPEVMAAEAVREVEAHGFSVLKMKVGMDPVDDVRRFRAVSEALAGRAVLQIDGNTGWSLWEALWALREMEAIGGLGAVEQPVASRREMAVLARTFKAPIMADEAIYAAHDAIDVVREEAASLALMKITKHGGVAQVRDIATVFGAANLGLSMAIYFDLIAAVASHLAAAFPCVTWPSPFTHLDASILKRPPVPDGLHLNPSDEPGWGMELDPDQVARYAIARATFGDTPGRTA
jgi:L-alanine-DL-glutamate epimerase-like enolase superfamily enzyme